MRFRLDFDYVDLALHTVPTIVLVSLAGFFLPQAHVWTVAVGATAGWLLRELAQHKWSFSEMGRQSWAEWIVPGVFATVVATLFTVV